MVFGHAVGLLGAELKTTIHERQCVFFYGSALVLHFNFRIGKLQEFFGLLN